MIECERPRSVAPKIGQAVSLPHCTIDLDSNNIAVRARGNAGNNSLQQPPALLLQPVQLGL